MIKRIFVIGVMAIGFSSVGYCQENDYNLKDNTFIMAANRKVTTPLYKWWAIIFTTVFDELKINLKIKSYPMKRASMEADEGTVSGEPVRIYSYANAHPNLVRVEEYVHMMPVTAYTTDPNFSVNGWESLKGSKLKMGYPRGFKFIKDNISKYSFNAIPLNIAKQGLEVLLLNRVDLFLDDSNSVDPILPLLPKKNRNRIHVAGLLKSVKLYMYIHKNHKALAPMISAELKKLRQKGLIQKYRSIAFGLGIF